MMMFQAGSKYVKITIATFLPSTMSPSEAEKLKAEGNTLFTKKDYASAIVKYSKAIAIEKNAVVFANRSACQRALKRSAIRSLPSLP